MRSCNGCRNSAPKATPTEKRPLRSERRETAGSVSLNGDDAVRQVRECRDWMAARLGADLVSDRGEGLEEVVVALLRRRRRMLATAESCTAGLVSARRLDSDDVNPHAEFLRLLNAYANVLIAGQH